ncbi:hypothetical protein BpHYR1_008789 [Brachionus plicatilis]|uniref:Uncharacterized protein n=1 Tax=Brachionus plicatilis TaxID=10195 RepID=A0A3M7SBZ8_BRAPC|nr:hypothetical protein BpHYR1_008789 [Brachionus plicatilis]
MLIKIFRGLPERFRSETEPVSSLHFLVEETHFGDAANNLGQNRKKNIYIKIRIFKKLSLNT